jgi:hypothetical protein
MRLESLQLLLLLLLSPLLLLLPPLLPLSLSWWRWVVVVGLMVFEVEVSLMLMCYV